MSETSRLGAWTFTILCTILACAQLSCSITQGPATGLVITLTDDADDVARKLTVAFIEADAEQAKRVTIPSEWDRIDELVERLRPMEWPIRRKGWVETMEGCVGHSTSDDQWTIDCYYQCERSGVIYDFIVEDIVVRRTEEGWKVYDWGTAGLD